MDVEKNLPYFENPPFQSDGGDDNSGVETTLFTSWSVHSNVASHRHYVTLSENQMTQLANGETVTVGTDVAANHNHELTLELDSTDTVVIDDCDNRGATC